MSVVIIREEMQFITGVVTSDLEYLLYLLLKNENKNTSDVLDKISNSDDIPYFKEVSLEDWFDCVEDGEL